MTKSKTESNERSQVYVTLCLYTTKTWETHKGHSTTKKLQCMMPSCRMASEPHQIIVRTRGRCTHRAHEFPSASGHSTHCWAHIVVFCAHCTGTQTHWLSKKQNHSFKLQERFWAFAREVHTHGIQSKQFAHQLHLRWCIPMVSSQSCCLLCSFAARQITIFVSHFHIAHVHGLF